MPNWVECNLELEGKYDDLMAFFNQNKNDSQELSFEKAVPYPDGEWDYDFCCCNWGTKWDANDVQVSFFPEELKDLNLNKDFKIVYDFLTAWCPPEKWLEVVGEKNKNIIFTMEFIEEGCGISGKIKYEEGDIKINEYLDFKDFRYKKYKEDIDLLLENYISSEKLFPSYQNKLEFITYITDLNDKINNDEYEPEEEDILGDLKYNEEYLEFDELSELPPETKNKMIFRNIVIDLFEEHCIRLLFNENILIDDSIDWIIKPIKKSILNDKSFSKIKYISNYLITDLLDENIIDLFVKEIINCF